MPVASCDNRVEFATSEKGKYENVKMKQSILITMQLFLERSNGKRLK
jgi:hypothetical protein